MNGSLRVNAFLRLKCFLGFEGRKVLINSFVLSNVTYYCPLVWSISSANSLLVVENLQIQALRFFHNNYGTLYEKLFGKSGRTSINVRKISLCVYRSLQSLNNVNPIIVKGNFWAANYKPSNTRKI